MLWALCAGTVGGCFTINEKFCSGGGWLTGSKQKEVNATRKAINAAKKGHRYRNQTAAVAGVAGLMFLVALGLVGGF
jgi:hypothetical protein